MGEDNSIPESVKKKFCKDLQEEMKIEKANKRKSSKRIRNLGKLSEKFKQ